MRVGTSVTEEASLITVEAEVARAGVEPGSGAGRKGLEWRQALR